MGIKTEREEKKPEIEWKLNSWTKKNIILKMREQHHATKSNKKQNDEATQ